ncbi:MAG: hypothetical protein OQJ76_04125 [Rhodospirillales bacterium]|nr:hypothetical protein [Rhodospirillales bacterium]
MKHVQTPLSRPGQRPRSVLRVLAGAAVLLVVLSACDNDTKTTDEKDPYFVHCRGVLNWVTQKIGKTEVLESRQWPTRETVRAIEILYELTVEKQGSPRPIRVRDTVVCEYAIDKTDGNNKGRNLLAQRILLRGIPFTDEELHRVNILIGLMGTKTP